MFLKTKPLNGKMSFGRFFTYFREQIFTVHYSIHDSEIISGMQNIPLLWHFLGVFEVVQVENENRFSPK